MIMDTLLDLPQLRTFYTLAQAGSFTACARKLGRTQSAVSHAMAKLEDLAGVPLLDRKGRDLGLTEEGRRLYLACEQAFATLDAAADDLRRHQTLARGRLRVGTTVEFGSSILMKHMQPFLTAHPDLEIDFTLSHDLLGPLLRDDLDLIIDCQEHPLPTLKKAPLFRETYVVACSKAFRKAHRLHLPGDLSGCPVLSLDKAGAWWNRFLMAVPDREQPQLDRIIAVNHIRAMVHAAMEGMGALLVPRYAVLEELRRGDLVALFPAIRPTEDRFSIYQKKVKASHEKQRLLTRYLQSLSPAEFGS
ncbi:LysR family transcriptional regulator [Geothrix limicola]|uniref:LysR family transcriptional regulator n=1 Tax=Geothrix limicola TaxID=2927978 RepID=A0ABQ5QJX8_9BACT|nr:LysR family transcriptional regulator [Geothrix limicola]GLH75012.1 LysR family transcriptional regulator [Geothrix limicola]